MKVANINSEAKSNQHKQQYPTAPPPRQVEVRGNNHHNCRVRFLIDETLTKRTLPISPKTTQTSWASWKTTNTSKATLRYCQQYTNVERRKAEELEEAAATTKMWVDINDQRTINAAQQAKNKIAAAAIDNGKSSIEGMLFKMETNLQQEKDRVDIMETITNDRVANLEETFDGDGEQELKDDEMRQAVMNGTVPTGIADAGCTSHCGKPIQPTCGKYEIRNNPFIPTGRKSSTIFSMAFGNVAPADNIMRLKMPIRSPADEINIVPGIKHNLLSMNQLAASKYITIFDEDEVNVYDATNTKVTVSRGDVLRGWCMPEEGLWRIPLVPNIQNVNTDTILMNKPPADFLLTKAPPPVNQILNVFESKTNPELVRYYHAAAEFPTKPSWLAAIKNGYYNSWTGLNPTVVTKHFPESEETWKGHGRKI